MRDWSVCVSAIFRKVLSFIVILLIILLDMIALVIGVLHQIVSGRVLNCFSSLFVIVLVVLTLWVLFLNLMGHFIVLSKILKVFSGILSVLFVFRTIFVARITQPPSFIFVGVSSFTLSLNKKRSVKHLSVYFDHFLFVNLFSPLFLLFELFDSFLYDRSRFSNVSVLAISENRSYIRSEFLLSHFSNSWGSFLFINHPLLFLLLFSSQIY